MADTFISLPIIQIDIEELRPQNQAYCSDEDFAVFLTNLQHVLAGKPPETDFQRCIADSLNAFYNEEKQDGEITLNSLIDELGQLAECTSIFASKSMASGQYSHIWVPAHHGWHNWLAFMEYFTFPRDSDEDVEWKPTFNPETYSEGSATERLGKLRQFFDTVAAKAKESAINQKQVMPVYTVELQKFPLQLVVHVLHADRKDDTCTLIIQNMADGSFKLTLKWNTANGQLSNFMGVHHRIIDARRHDEHEPIDPDTNHPLPPRECSLQIQV
ncbi:MAG: hypothetical protein DI628_06505 [Blastochloris viridis]|uniref:Uncharacterized protein n=1 Tax=Blastochloris viridis TaxID=1079 RepID=A0A6N4R9Z2_BLAVI|nr:MAG: hypothetical protein DI628_06505 [Blastochloris viridis]